MRATRAQLRRRLRPWTAFALVLLSAGSAGAADFKLEKKRYKAYLERPSLWMRHRGRVRFAQTKDARALEILAKSYAKPEEPKDQVRYLLASMCADNFDGPPHVPALRAWRKKHAKPEDAWLWYRTFRTELAAVGPDLLFDTARSQREPFLRTAALEALVAAKHEMLVPLLSELLADLPSRPLDRALLVESAAHGLFVHRTQRTSGPWQTLAKTVIQLLDDPHTLQRTRLVIARRLRQMFAVEALDLTAAPWLERLEGKPRVVRGEVKPQDAGILGARFFGIEVTGRRVVYVIDMSDSMLTPLTDREMRDLRKAPVTGSPSPPELPWYRINTRFDLAREFLKVSVQDLPAGTSFCVVHFGTDAGLMASTPGLRPVEPDTVGRLVKELDAIVPGPAKPGRPYGTLRGTTNLHGGLHRAFKVRTRGLVRTAEYVDPDGFEEGADTIFLLSDGDPTWDDWPARDKREAEDEPGDPESRNAVDGGEWGNFYGPYAVKSTLYDDLERLNLFRKAEIHCISIGEGRKLTFLDTLRRLGLGKLKPIPAR